MTLLADRPIRVSSLVFFDLETTGLRPDRGGRICEMAVVGPEGVRFDWTSDHDPPPDEAVARQLPPLFSHLQDRVVVGHNLQFDFHFLTYEAERLGLGGFDVQFVDTLGLARRLLPLQDGYQLGALLTVFDVEPKDELHTALGDALATRALFWHLVDAGGLETLSEAGAKRLRWNAQ